MNICVFDTETTSIDKPFCYNIGYVIVNTDNWENLLKREFCVEQVWHNPMLFTTAYYADKRPFYVQQMRARAIKLDKFGYICQNMIRDFANYEVKKAFAYNSPFDEKVFDFNCDWFKCNNPFDNVSISDIRGFVHQFIIDDKFTNFCEEHEYFTESGNYSTTAETLFRYITNDITFDEKHTALDDSEIESEILHQCVLKGASLERDYKTRISIPRKIDKKLTIFVNGKNQFEADYHNIRINKEKTEIKLKW